MLAKIALPVLAGTTAVRTTCMLFYQAMLLAVGAPWRWIRSIFGSRQWDDLPLTSPFQYCL
jgi:hypothetical protein